ncbi:MAG: FecR domain-containing protein [Deltaproteobacteria bacterium]|nr:FecR domain-containing protein [Deltaproteobacteria bacterium]
MSERRPPLADPIVRALKEPFEEAEVDRWWSDVLGRRLVRRRHPTLGWAIAGLLAVALSATVLLDRAHDHAPVAGLVLADRTTLPGLPLRTEEAGRHLVLEDGTRLSLDPRTALSPLLANEHQVLLLLDRGRLEVDAPADSARAWTLEAGLARVEAFGAHVRLWREGGGVRIEVVRGVALVQSALLPELVRRLAASEHLELGPVAPAPPTPAPLTQAPPTLAPAPTAPSLSSDAALVSTPPRGAHGANQATPDPEVPPTVETEDISVLLSRADALRADGHVEEAVSLLERAIADHTEDASSALAAFTLARIELDRDRPVAAARALEIALGRGLPVALEEDAIARLVEAHQRSHDATSAEIWRRTYRARFPGGTKLEALGAGGGP